MRCVAVPVIGAVPPLRGLGVRAGIAGHRRAGGAGRASAPGGRTQRSPTRQPPRRAATTVSDIQVLVTELGDDVVVTDAERMEKYRWDRANDPDAGVPLAVVRAESTEHVQAAVRFAAAHGIPVVPRGAGSGLSGGASAVAGCLVVSTERMRDIEVDPITRTAVVQPGLMNAEVKAAAAEHDLWYPPDPSSYEICSIGGNVATNAGGLCCVKYGVTTDYVLGLTVVLADGSAVRLGGPAAQGRRRPVADQAVRRLRRNARHRHRDRAAADPEAAAARDAGRDVRHPRRRHRHVLAITRRLRPSMLEFMDRPTINAVEDVTKMGLDRDAAAMLVIQSDEPAGHAAAECELIAALRGQQRHRGLLHRRPRGGRGVRRRPPDVRSRPSSAPAPCCSRTSAYPSRSSARWSTASPTSPRSARSPSPSSPTPATATPTR